MSGRVHPSERRRTRTHRTRGRRAWPRRLVAALTVALVFALGIALGQALEDGPQPVVTQTSVRTLEPLPQRPAGTP